MSDRGHGTPLPGPTVSFTVAGIPAPQGSRVEQRFFEKLHLNANGCWIWTGAVWPTGYAAFKIGGRRSKTARAHRWAYEHFVGPIPAGLELDHLCRVRHCVNPEHLEPVTRSTNNQRGLLGAPRATCKHGHAWRPETTRWITKPGGKPYRTCRICIRARKRAER